MPDQNPPANLTQPTPQPVVSPPDTTQNLPSQPPTVPADDIAAPAPAEAAGSNAPPFDIPPVVTPPEKPGNSRKVVATILGLLVLVGGITAGVVLVRQQQIFREKAMFPGEDLTSGGTETGGGLGGTAGGEAGTETGGGGGNGGGSGGGGCSEGATEANDSGGINYCSGGNWYSCPVGQTYINGQCQSAPPTGGGKSSGVGGSIGFGTSCGTRTISSCAPGREVKCVEGSWICVGAGASVSRCTSADISCPSGQSPTGYVPDCSCVGAGASASLTCGTRTISSCEPGKEVACVNGSWQCVSKSGGGGCSAGEIPTNCPSVGWTCLSQYQDIYGNYQTCPVQSPTGNCPAGSPGWTPSECGAAGGNIGASSGGGLYCCTFPASKGCTSGSPGWTPAECGMAGGTVGAPSQPDGGLYCCSFPSTVTTVPIPKSGQTTPTTGGAPTTEATTPTLTLPPGVTASCLNIKAFDTSWNQLSTSQLSALKVGDTVRFTVAASASTGTFDQARFTINGTARAAVTQMRPGTQEFYDEYVIPAGTTSFNVSAQVHNTGLGWF